MKIKLTSIFVDDQDKAIRFYTEVLGFVKKTEMPARKFKWLPVVSPEELAEVELLLEPNNNPAAKFYQEAIFKQGIPAVAFEVEDIQKEYERMKKTGVAFSMTPTKMGPVKVAIFDDRCGNFIQTGQKQ